MTTPKAKPLPTPGRLKIGDFSCDIFSDKGEVIGATMHKMQKGEIWKLSGNIKASIPEAQANAAFIIASWNAMQSAAKRLSMRPDDLAEALADGGIAEMVEALRNLASIEDNTPDAYECADAFFDAGEVAKAILAKLPAAGKAGG